MTANHKPDIFCLNEASIVALAQKMAGKELVFKKLESDCEKAELGLFRLQIYQQKRPYLLRELSSNGLDIFDEKAYNFAAFEQGQLCAAVRLLPFPFESSSFFSHEELELFLGKTYQKQYLEFSRLLVQNKDSSLKLTKAIILFAGLKTLEQGFYQKYFYYQTKSAKRLVRKLNPEHLSALSFQIPQRGPQIYELFRGDFLSSLNTLHKSGFTLNQTEA